MINLTGNNNRAREWWHKHIMGSRICSVTRFLTGKKLSDGQSSLVKRWPPTAVGHIDQILREYKIFIVFLIGFVTLLTYGSCVKNNARKNPGGKETCTAKDVGVEKIYEHVQFRGWNYKISWYHKLWYNNWKMPASNLTNSSRYLKKILLMLSELKSINIVPSITETTQLYDEICCFGRYFKIKDFSLWKIIFDQD
jgi:hypothetical protein